VCDVRLTDCGQGLTGAVVNTVMNLRIPCKEEVFIAIVSDCPFLLEGFVSYAFVVH
jgi:hypothetical protein